MGAEKEKSESKKSDSPATFSIETRDNVFLIDPFNMAAYKVSFLQS